MNPNDYDDLVNRVLTMREAGMVSDQYVKEVLRSHPSMAGLSAPPPPARYGVWADDGSVAPRFFRYAVDAFSSATVRVLADGTLEATTFAATRLGTSLDRKRVLRDTTREHFCAWAVEQLTLDLQYLTVSTPDDPPLPATPADDAGYTDEYDEENDDYGDEDDPGEPAYGETQMPSTEVYSATLVGMTEEQATDKAGTDGYVVRVVARDRQAYMGTRDYRPRDRINLKVKDGLVISALFG